MHYRLGVDPACVFARIPEAHGAPASRVAVGGKGRRETHSSPHGAVVCAVARARQRRAIFIVLQSLVKVSKTSGDS